MEADKGNGGDKGVCVWKKRQVRKERKKKKEGAGLRRQEDGRQGDDRRVTKRGRELERKEGVWCGRVVTTMWEIATAVRRNLTSRTHQKWELFSQTEAISDSVINGRKVWR